MKPGKGRLYLEHCQYVSRERKLKEENEFVLPPFLINSFKHSRYIYPVDERREEPYWSEED